MQDNTFIQFLFNLLLRSKCDIKGSNIKFLYYSFKQNYWFRVIYCIA